MSSEPPKPGAVPGWGQPAQPQPPQDAPAPPGPSPTAGGPIPGWGQPAASEPAAPPSTPAPPPASAPPASGQPPASPAWGAPAPASPGAQPGWGAPPAGSSGAQPGWGAPAGGPGPVPGGAPAGGWNPQPAAAAGSSGCLKIVLILVVVGVVLITLLVVALGLFVNRVADNLGVNGDGSVGKACAIIDDSTLSAALGTKSQALELSGLYDATIGLVLDKRVLPNAEDCWITGDQTTPVGRIARYVGGDAAAVFQAERKNAAPTSQDQGNGLSIESSGYFGGDVSGLGDEAFCTGISDAIQAGVLARRGDTLVYVSLSGPADDTTPAFDTTADGVITAPSICAQAQEVARRILP